MIDLQVINDNVWVFLSHSHNDYDKVIQVRNMLEKRKFKPLMFFLKCLENDTEIDSLIKREIDCRYRFILCDSANAQASKWVQEEVRYIKEEKKRYCEMVNLDTMSIKQVNAQLQKFEQRSTVTILYSNNRKNSLKPVIDELLTYDMKVQVGKLEDLINESNPVETLNELVEVGFVAIMPNEDVSPSFINDILQVPSTISKKVIILYEERQSLLMEIIFDRIDDYNELLGWSYRLQGEVVSKLIDNAIDKGATPTYYLVLANLYENGHHGIEIDFQKAIYWLECAKSAGLAVESRKQYLNEKLKKQSERKWQLRNRK